MARRHRPATLRLRFTLKGISILYRGRVVARVPDHVGAQRFIDGWREAEAERRAAAWRK